MGIHIRLYEEHLSKREKMTVKAFHDYLRSKYTFDQYWRRLQTMLPEMSDNQKRKEYIGRIWNN